MRKFILIIFCIVYLFFFGVFDVKAQVITQRWDFTINVPGRYGYQDYIFSGAPFFNVPQGKLIFTANFNSINTNYAITSISSIYLTSVNGNKFACTLGNYYVNAGLYSSNTGTDHNYYQSISVECPIDFSNGDNLKSVMFVLNGAVDNSTTYHIKTSEFATFVSDSNSQIANNTNDIKNSITDSNIDTNGSNSATSGFSSSTNSGMSNTPVSGLITLPVTFLTGVSNAISSSCTNINYIELFNYQLVLPCLNLSQRLGNVWTIIDTIFSCMLIFSIGKSLVRTFARLSDMDTNIMYECYANGKSHRGDGD